MPGQCDRIGHRQTSHATISLPYIKGRTMISIKLVRVGNQLIGKTASDRWNMIQLGLGHALTTDRNQTHLKRIRRAWFGVFHFSVTSRDSVIWESTPTEKAALGTAIATIAA